MLRLVARPAAAAQAQRHAAVAQRALVRDALRMSSTVSTVSTGGVEHPREQVMTMEGNQAAAHVAYAMSDNAFIYPISPATSMGEWMDSWRTAGRKNIFGETVGVQTMQSEAGAAGAVHGALTAGALSTTFTASQGLLLMIPNLYLIAGELMPAVFHVSARAVSKHALTIFNDHSDVMACRQTGWAQLCAASVQEVMDMALVSHLATLKARIPFMHFFDGYRTSAEIKKIHAIPYDTIKGMVNQDLIRENLLDKALNPNHPHIRGTGQRPDIFFQGTVAAHRFYLGAPDIVQDTMNEVAAVTGRQYHLFDYHGHPEAERVIVMMGSAAQTTEQAVDYLNGQGEKVGVVQCRLFRPWKAEALRDVIPKTAQRIAVLDRTREDGALGGPLHLDVATSFSEVGDNRLIVGGQYGLASKEYTPATAKAVFDNLAAETPKNRFVVGINDDVTHTSLEIGPEFNVQPDGTRQCLFWGLGTDGTVGANKQAIKTIGNKTDLFTQGHFAYDSHKGGGVTMSHLRFGPQDIKSEYEIKDGADYIACGNTSYVDKFQIIKPIKQGGIVVLNTPWATVESMEANLPADMLRKIAENDVQLYSIDATSIARNVGLGQRINMVMQACFYHLSGVLPAETALATLKEDIENQYGKKGPKVVQMNKDCVDQTVESLVRIDYPRERWLSVQQSDLPTGVERVEKYRTYRRDQMPEFVQTIMDPVLALEGDELPVSVFEPGGAMPAGTTNYEKRGIAPEVPVWKPENCTQCNYCTIVCPHAVIRPFLFTKDELRSSPEGFQTLKAQGGAEVAGLNYSIQLATMDCTGCEVCVKSCPDDALYMAPFEEAGHAQIPGYEFSMSVPDKGDRVDKFTVKGSQFQQPLMEFSGACAGCGETPYVKLLTQLFGERLMIANASGCSSVWGGTATTNPYTTNAEGKGPAWGRSLFEDNAEYGFGMALATMARRNKLANVVKLALDGTEGDVGLSGDLRKQLTNWLKHADDPDKSGAISKELDPLLTEARAAAGDNRHPLLEQMYQARDMFPKSSQWIIGGDGWAFDIGFGGLDHVLTKGENVNILVLDTEMYSNTGGQASTSTAQSAVVKYASSGKRVAKKDLGQLAMAYENVYVASVSLGADMGQTVQAFKEAEEFPGTSLMIAYSPCIDWGIDMSETTQIMKSAVDSGYWPLYRYDPRNTVRGEQPFMLDSRRIKQDLSDFLMAQNRFAALNRNDPELAEKLQSSLRDHGENRLERHRRAMMDDYELLDTLKAKMGEQTGDKITILYGSETGNTADLAKMLTYEMKRRNVRVKCMAMDDYDVSELPNEKVVINLVATCGQGEFPANCRLFYEALQDESLSGDFLNDVQFATFGMGDSGYVFFNEAARLIDERMQALGGKQLMPMGNGDDQDEDKWETAWENWSPDLWNELGTEAPPMELLPPQHDVNVFSAAEATQQKEVDFIMPTGATMLPLTTSRLLTPGGRDVRHFEWSLAGSGVTYEVGDALGVHSANAEARVAEFLDWYGMKPDDIITFDDTVSGRDPSLPQTVTAQQLFTQVLDIFGRPKRQFYDSLACLATNDSEKEELMHLIAREGAGDLRSLINDTTTYADLMKKFPSARVPIEYVLDLVPAIKPRLYSIASAPEMHPDHIHLCIVEEDWDTSSGEHRHGQSTWFMRNQYAGRQWGMPGHGPVAGDTPVEPFGTLDASKAPRVPCRVNPAVVHQPEPEDWVIMVGLGTGMAPFRSFIQQRKVQKEQGMDVGPMALFFGARHEATEYLYGDEIESYHEDGLVNELRKAFSRDQPEKIYAQHRIAEDPGLIYKYMVEKKGKFYLCGPAGGMPAQMRQAVIDAFVTAGDMTPEAADKLVTEMQISGHYNVEVW